jgi:hypothetical protein
MMMRTLKRNWILLVLILACAGAILFLVAPWKDRPQLSGDRVIAAVRNDLEADGFKLNSLSPRQGDRASYRGEGMWEGVVLSPVSFNFNSSGSEIRIGTPPLTIDWLFDERARFVQYKNSSDPEKWSEKFVPPTIELPTPKPLPR